MNTTLLKSKKFRAAILAAISSLLAFLVSEFGLKLDVEKTMTLVGLLMTPLLIYIGAEGYSERDAKTAQVQSETRSQISEQLLQTIMNKDNNKNE